MASIHFDRRGIVDSVVPFRIIEYPESNRLHRKLGGVFHGKPFPLRCMRFDTDKHNGYVFFDIKKSEFCLGLFHGKNLYHGTVANTIKKFAKSIGCNMITSIPYDSVTKHTSYFFDYEKDGTFYKVI